MSASPNAILLVPFAWLTFCVFAVRMTQTTNSLSGYRYNTCFSQILWCVYCEELLCCIAFAQFCVLFSPYPVVSVPCATIAVITRAWHVYMGLFCHCKQPAGCQTANAFLSKMPIRNACNSRIKRPLAIWNQIDLCVCVFAGHISYT